MAKVISYSSLKAGIMKVTEGWLDCLEFMVNFYQTPSYFYPTRS